MKLQKCFFGGFVALLLCGCAIDGNENDNNSNNNKITGAFAYNNNGEISFKDKEYESDKSGLTSDNKVTIVFNGMEEPTITGECADITIKKDDTNETEHNNKSNDKMRQCENTDNQFNGNGK